MDHPRSRGVYGRRSPSTRRSPGSSPLARGLPAGPSPPARPAGIIPARAGFTVPHHSPRSPPWDHPRSRGVYAAASPSAVTPMGSSPLARGLRTIRDEDALVRGIIPARAGFTSRPGVTATPSWDHPRSRGVYRRTIRTASYHPGSSPLARGLLTVAGRGVRDRRIIPARAGFTRRSLGPPTWTPDHPRSRGVYVRSSQPTTAAPGSSPLARGLRRGRRDPLGLPRIIPARAGFT